MKRYFGYLCSLTLCFNFMYVFNELNFFVYYLVFMRLFFDIADAQAWRTINSIPCHDFGGATCDTYVRVKIDGKQLYQTEIHNDTSHPVFNEIFETDWITEDSIIEFTLLDRNEGSEYPEITMAEWRGNAEYFLTHQLFNGTKYARAKHRNSLVVSTSVLELKHADGKWLLSEQF